jgi:hypothetical protein
VIALIALATAGVVLWISGSETDTDGSADGPSVDDQNAGPPPKLARLRPDRRRPLFGFGDSSALYPYPGAPSADELADLEAGAGARVARLTIRWDVVQPRPPSTTGQPEYHWERFDPFVDALLARGIRPLPVLLGAPSWARDPAPECGGDLCPPAKARLSDWAAFVAAAASRYPDAIGIEIWNEPNLRAFWRTSGGPDPARYATLFESALSAVRSVDPDMTVLIGGLAHVSPASEPALGLQIPSFLRGFYDVVDESLLDPGVAVGIHVYPRPARGGALQPRRPAEATLAEARAIVKARDRGRSLWVTEFGASTTETGTGGRLEQRQQAETILALLKALEGAPDVPVAVLYTVVERPPGENAIEQGYGVVGPGPSFTPKLAYCRIARQSGVAPPTGCS